MMRLNCYLNRKVLCQIAIIFHFFAKIFAYFKKILYLCTRVSQILHILVGLDDTIC